MTGIGNENRLKIGKLDYRLFDKLLSGKLGYSDRRVIQGPGIGVDAAIIDAEDVGLIAVHSDPITAAGELAGWLSVNIASNDVAVVGATPKWLSIVLLFREDVSQSEMEKLVDQIDLAAKELKASIIGGHTEIVKDLKSSIIVATSIGIVDRDKYVLSGNASPGDIILLTKKAGLEGTAILATDAFDDLVRLGVDEETLKRARNFYRMVSVVKEALTLSSRGLATSMHDPTEGGILGGLLEVAYASGNRIKLYVDEVPVAEETIAICRALSIDPLKLISSGSLIATVRKEDLDEALKAIKDLGSDVKVIGEVIEGSPAVEIVDRSGRSVKAIDSWIQDEIYRILS